MKEKNFEWLKLDNAAKIYPAAMSRNWTAMFRLSATLKESIDPLILQQALSSTLKRIPSFALRLKKGIFWYYLEKIDGMPKVTKDYKNPLVRMRLNEDSGFMFRVRYYENRIAVEIFHVLTDGTGGMIFLNTLIAEYIKLKYKEQITHSEYVLDCNDEASKEEWEDSFLRYARDAKSSRGESKAYHIKGTKEEKDILNIITAIIPVDKIKDKAKQYSVTVNEFLTAVMLMSLQKMQSAEISKKAKMLPPKVSVPVNLRKFYDTKTLRNFANYVNPGLEPAHGIYSFEEITKRVKHFMGYEVTEKQLNARMSANVASEKNILLRPVPLVIKSLTMKAFFYIQGDRCNSVTLSNLGVVKLPEQMEKYLERVEFILGPFSVNPVMCACVSFKDKLYLNFSSTIKQTDFQRLVLTTMVKMGIPVLVESNRR